MTEGKKEKGSEPSDLIRGRLNILGLEIDLGELLEAPEKLTGRVEELREKLKAAGGREVLSDEEWRQGRSSISGHIRTRGLLGDTEYHIGTMGRPTRREAAQPAPQPPEVVEPPVDVFYDGRQVTIVADLPGVRLEDLNLKVENKTFSISTKATAQRSYRKELSLETEVEPESLQADCRNGVLEAHLRERARGSP